MLQGHHDEVKSVKFSSDSNRVLSCSDDKSIRVWNIANSQCIAKLKLHENINDFSFHLDGSLVVGFDDGSLEFWENVGDDTDYRWQLRWSTDIDSRALYVSGLNIQNVKGLSNQYRFMLEQRGAITAARNDDLSHHSSLEDIQAQEQSSINFFK